MARRDYPRLGLIEFARHLLDAGDLDPIYTALNRVKWPLEQRHRWLAAYCAYYSAGVASYMSEAEGDRFWELMATAAHNEDATPTPYGGRWPRGHERRHFRGVQAVKGVADWQARFPLPEDLFAFVSRGRRIAHFKLMGPQLFAEVRARALQLRSVGTWLSFKMVDLADACLGAMIDQTNVMDFMYEVPQESLLRVWREQLGLPPGMGRPKDTARTVVAMNDWLRDQLADRTIPHKPGEPLDAFCLETIWCKHQSHLNGHYPPYNDNREIRDGLAPWVAHSQSAVEFLAAMPPEGDSA